ncbi:OmpA family protein [Pedobacter sp. SYSU D00535]|uniref:OmpA family protein n=1 Tax=Pedobacter sp. SYSU D00535 TaxID=2810308 RepID=UPI001A97BBD7|nr:OmpA family protein [Pedobacter sp. SYSU D00535]
MTVKKLLLVFLISSAALLIPGNIFSDNIKKANKYYEKYDYKLALDIYEDIMRKKPSLEVAQKLANCYRFINDTEGAERAYAQVLTFSGFDPINYKYYADALKQNGKFEEAKRNYTLWGQNAPAQAGEATRLANSTDVARMWAENPDQNVKIENASALNTPYSEFSPVIYKEGIVFTSDRLFSQKTKGKKKEEIFGWTGNPYLKIYQLTSLNGGNLQPFSSVLNEDYHNGPAVFTNSGDLVFFTRTEAPKGKKKDRPSIVTKKIYYSRQSGNTWESPRPLELNSPDYSIQHPALSPDGSILYFASDMPGGLGGMDLYASKKTENGAWGQPVNCGPNINTAEDEVFPVVRSDGRFYFSSKGHVGMGGLDIFTAQGSYNTFKLPENLKTPTNSTKDDFGILFLGEFNGYFSSNRGGGKGLDDIYSFSMDVSKPVFAIKGEVVDKATGSALSNTEVVLVNKTTGEQTRALSDAAGKFYFELEPEMDYVVSGNRDKLYSRQEGQISTKGLKESTVFDVQFELEKAEDDVYLVRLDNIYYNFNKWNIRPDATDELNKVVSFMNKVTGVNIEMRSHTDARGKAAYNKWLSQKRAESAIRYLVNRGVASSRLSAVGLGETELVNRCSDGVKCSEREHQLNRRTEFKVVKIKPENAGMPTAVAVSSRKK